MQRHRETNANVVNGCEALLPRHLATNKQVPPCWLGGSTRDISQRTPPLGGRTPVTSPRWILLSPNSWAESHIVRWLDQRYRDSVYFRKEPRSVFLRLSTVMTFSQKRLRQRRATS